MCFLLIPPPLESRFAGLFARSLYHSLELLGKGHHVLNKSINYVQWVLGGSIRIGDSKFINASVTIYNHVIWGKLSKCIVCW